MEINEIKICLNEFFGKIWGIRTIRKDMVTEYLVIAGAEDIQEEI